MRNYIVNDRLKHIIRNRISLKQIFIKHLKFNVGSIDCIVSFSKDNRKVLLEYEKDCKPFIRWIIKTINTFNTDNDWLYKSKLMNSLQIFLSEKENLIPIL